MEPDPVSVEIIENCQAEFIPFSVVRLGPLGTKTNSGELGLKGGQEWRYMQKLPSSVGPVHVVVSPARGPADVPVVDFPASPEISLPVLGHQTKEVILLLPAVQTDGPHVVGLAEPLSLALSELGATQPPADKEVLTLHRV